MTPELPQHQEPHFPPHTPPNIAGNDAEGLAPPPLFSPRRSAWKSQARSGLRGRTHAYLNGQPCDRNGHDLEDDALPPPRPPPPENFFPFSSASEFRLADLLYRKMEISGNNANELMDILAEHYGGESPPFSNVSDLNATIDTIQQGSFPWQAFSVEYDGDQPEVPPSWMTTAYEVWYRDPLQVMESQIGNPDFNGEIDYAPKQVQSKDGKRQYCDLMSGNWAWRQADILAADPETHAAMFAPVVLGSDKTTVSVATGQSDFYPQPFMPI